MNEPRLGWRGESYKTDVLSSWGNLTMDSILDIFELMLISLHGIMVLLFRRMSLFLGDKVLKYLGVPWCLQLTFKRFSKNWEGEKANVAKFLNPGGSLWMLKILVTDITVMEDDRPSIFHVNVFTRDLHRGALSTAT